MKKLFVLSLLVLAACGKGGSSGAPTATPLNLVPTGTPYQATLIATRNPNAPGVTTLVQTSALTLPQPGDISVVANASEFYHASLTAGSVVCDYIHDAGASFFRAGAGCTTLAATVSLNSGDSITLTINNTVTQATQVQVTLNLVGY